MQLESSVTLFDDDKVESKFAELQITADGITSEVSRKVGNDEVISRINQSAEAVKIQASKISINGVITAINNDTTTTIDGDKITTGTLSASAVDAQSGTFNTANIPNLSANKITTDTINIARIPSTARNDTYITDIGSGGIKIHDAVTSANRVEITSGGMNVIQDNNSVAKFGSSIRLGDSSGQRIAMNSSAIWFYDSNGDYKQTIESDGIHIFTKINGTTKEVATFGSSITFYKPGTNTAAVTMSSSRVMIGGFEIVPASNGRDYLVSDWSTGGVDYRTFIRSATSTDKGDTWAFSTQYSTDAGENYYGNFHVCSNGKMHVTPINANGALSGSDFVVDSNYMAMATTNVQFRVQPSKAFASVYNGGMIEVNSSGVYMNLDDNDVTAKANLYITQNGYIRQTDNSSSKYIKEDVTTVINDDLSPNNLYDVDVVQFKYKDGIIDEKDIRCHKNLIGFIIEDLNDKYPIAVDKSDENNSKTWAWNERFLIPPMLKLIQDQKEQIDELKFRMREIEEEINGQGTIN